MLTDSTENKVETNKIFGQLILIHIIVLLTYIGLSLPYSIFPSLFAANKSNISILQYSLLISIYPLGQAIGMVNFGNISDTSGRKKVLLFTLCGAMITYLFSGVLIATHSYILLTIIRFFCGMFEGNYSIALSVVHDLAQRPGKTKVKWFGRINIALTLGFIIGPFLGSIFSDKNIISWFDYSTPFYLAALITVATYIAVKIFFIETLDQKTFFRNRWGMILKTSINRIFFCLKKPIINSLILINLFITISTDILYQFIPVYLVHKWNSSQKILAFAIFILSIGKIAGNGYLINVFDKVIKNSLITIALGLIMLFLITLELIFSNDTYRYLGLLFLLGICIAIIITNMSVIISNSTSTQTQGTVLSVSQSLRILIGALFCNVAALTCYVSFSAPFILSITFSGVALLTIFLFSKKYSYLEIKCVESTY